MSKSYWLMKSEPETYSIDHFMKDKQTLWDGIRNYQARNFMIKDMAVGDEFLFYHSNAKPPGVAGRGIISKPAQPDPSAMDHGSKYYDPKSTKERPIWECVTVQFKKKFKNFISLPDIRNEKKLAKMMLIKKGARLSIQPLSKDEFRFICQMGEK